MALSHGGALLSNAALLVGSPAALASSALEASLRASAVRFPLLVPVGALWGAEDLQRMALADTLRRLHVTMTFHPRALKPAPNSDVAHRLHEYLRRTDDAAPPAEPCVLYDGPVRAVCAQAPNNVNTMACAALAASTLGFDGVRGTLQCSTSTHAHVIAVDVEGPNGFRVHSERHNPANAGAVTGQQTLYSFLASLLRAAQSIASGSRRSGLHFT